MLTQHSWRSTQHSQRLTQHPRSHMRPAAVDETVSSPNGPETSIAQLSTFSGGVSLAAKGSSLSAGALAGIVVGGVVFAAAIAAAAILIIKLRNPVAGGETYTPTSGSQSPPAPGSAPGPFTNMHFADHPTV